MDTCVDVIILALTKDAESCERTKKCIDSYLNTAGDLIRKIFVVETNTDWLTYHESEKVEFIKPDKQFNYNEFYNIALAKCTSEFIIGPNNDIIIQKNCIQNLIEQFARNSDIQSLCPIDRDWHRHTRMYLPNEDKIYFGYETSLHMYGCIFMCRRSLFEKIGYLDERFFFFYQDNDYIKSLERLGLLHGVYTGARVGHESGGSNKIATGRCTYTPTNMNTQGDIFMNKWFVEEPFKSGGYKKFKEYK